MLSCLDKQNCKATAQTDTLVDKLMCMCVAVPVCVSGITLHVHGWVWRSIATCLWLGVRTHHKFTMSGCEVTSHKHLCLGMRSHHKWYVSGCEATSHVYLHLGTRFCQTCICTWSGSCKCSRQVMHCAMHCSIQVMHCSDRLVDATQLLFVFFLQCGTDGRCFSISRNGQQTIFELLLRWSTTA